MMSFRITREARVTRLAFPSYCSQAASAPQRDEEPNDKEARDQSPPKSAESDSEEEATHDNSGQQTPLASFDGEMIGRSVTSRYDRQYCTVKYVGTHIPEKISPDCVI